MSMHRLYTGIKTLILGYYSLIAFLITRIDNLLIITVANTQKRQILNKRIKREHSPFYLFLSNPNQRRISAFLHRPVVLLTLAVSGEFLPAFVSARGTQRNRYLRVIPRTFNSR